MDNFGSEGFHSLVELLEKRTSELSDTRAFQFLEDGEREGDALTFASLRADALRIADAVRHAGAGGERVLLLYPPGLDFVRAFYGALLAPAVAVPAYPPDPTRLERSLSRMRAIVDDCAPSVVLSTSGLNAMAHQFGEGLSWLLDIPWIATDTLANAPASGIDVPVPGRDDLAFLQYTSGSTGTPKGVMVSHGNLLSTMHAIQTGMETQPRERIVTWLPQFHDMGLVLGVLLPVFANLECIMLAPDAFLRRPLRWLEAISNYRASYSCGPNFAYELCSRKVTDEAKAALDLSCWAISQSGAEPIRRSTLEGFGNAFASTGFRFASFGPGYGLAEATLKVSATPKQNPPGFEAVDLAALRQHRAEIVAHGSPRSIEVTDCGVPYNDTEIRIVDPETCMACEERAVGEIWIRGTTVAKGYWNKPEATAGVFEARLAESGDGPFLRTGDLGFLHHGHLFVTGRIKESIIVHGQNVYPADIEHAVAGAHPALRPGGACAFGYDADGEERLGFAHEVDPAAIHADGTTPDAVAALLRERVHAGLDLTLDTVLLLPPRTLPKTSSGKLQRLLCRDLWQSGELERLFETSAHAPRTADIDTATRELQSKVDWQRLPFAQRVARLESLLRGIAAQALSLAPEDVPSTLPLVELGLDSVAGLDMLGQLEQATDLHLDSEGLLQDASIASLATTAARRLDTAPAAPSQAAVEEGAL